MPITFSSMPSTRGMQAVTQQMVQGGSSGLGSALTDHPTQSSTAIDGWASILFGLPFLLVGLVPLAAALNLIQGGMKHAPDWLIGIIGGMFSSAGVFLVGHGFRGVIRKSEYRREAAQHPGDIWYADYHWSKNGFNFSAFRAMLGRLLAALAWYTFLVPFFWIGFTQRGTWLFGVVASIFGLLGIFFWVRWARMLGQLIRYGNSFLCYDQFPYFLGSTLTARLRTPKHISDLDQLTLTLRCVMERYVASGTGKDRSTSVVCYELYSQQKQLSREQLASFAGGEIPLQFRVPADQPATTLIATPPTYWEIEARGSSQEVKYQAYFLVPIYKAS
jgi:hypothetical protein